MNIIELAKEAGVLGGFDELHPSIEKFAALVRAEALDEAAKVCDEHPTWTGRMCAAVIMGLKDAG